MIPAPEKESETVDPAIAADLAKLGRVKKDGRRH